MSSTAESGTDRPAGIPAVFELPAFRFESGERLERLRLAYVTYGRMNAARDNVLLVLPGTSNLSHSVVDAIGPGRAYDTDRYCVVSCDSIGGGRSSQPADGLGAAFPRYGIRDMVHAHHLLVTQGLGLGRTPLAAVAGASMGAFQALEWAIHYPDSLRAAVLQVPATQAGALIRQTTRRMREMIELDPNWRSGQYTEQPLEGLRLAGRHYYAWTVTDDYIETRGDDVEREAQATGERFAQWDAWSIIRRYQASSAHDVALPFEGDLDAALSRVSARTLVLPCTQDRLLGIESARHIARGVRGARLAEIQSSRGHMAWRPLAGSPETAFMTREIREFLG